MAGLKNSNAEARIAKRVESLVRSKVTDDLGIIDKYGRQVEVSFKGKQKSSADSSTSAQGQGCGFQSG